MATNNYNQQSSGRWDADGSWEDAVQEQRESALKWANSLSPKHLHWAVMAMACDPNAFTLYERRSILIVVANKLEKICEERV